MRLRGISTKRRKLRNAFFRLRRHWDILFAYETFPDLNFPKTNHVLEVLNTILKTELRLHRGISTKQREALIATIIIAHTPKQNEERSLSKSICAP